MDISALFDSRLFYFLRQDPVTAALIDIMSDPIQDTYDVCAFILGAQNIDTAEGEQLEFLGEMIGVSRPPAEEPDIFTLTRIGESVDHDNKLGFFDDTDTVEIGGYMVKTNGLVAVDGSDMSDADYRYLIRQKAASYRKKMTRVNLFNYLIAFGTKCLIDDDTRFEVELDPLKYYALNEWEKWYAINKGFKPAGIRTFWRDNLRHGDSI